MDLKRIGTRPIFWAVFLAGLIYALIPVIQTWPHGVDAEYYISYPRNPYVSWMYFTGDTYYMYALTFPLLASLAFSDAYAEDFNTGFIKNILTKVNKKRYLLSRYAVNFCIGGLMATLPLTVNFLGEMAAYPLIDNHYFLGMPVVTGGGFWPELFYSHPLVYILLRLGLLFLFGGMLASLGLAFSTVVKNRYIVLIFPFLFVLMMDVVANVLGMYSLTLLFLGNVEASWELAVWLIPGIGTTFIWFYVLGEKNETI